MLIGYSRCSTNKQDLRAQKEALAKLGIGQDRIYVDFGLTGTNRARPGLKEALAACREADTFSVIKLDRLARSVRDAQDIISDLADRGVKFALGGSVYDWADPFSRMFLQILAVFAEFEANLIKMRTIEGMAIAKSKGKLKGKAPKLKAGQRAHLLTLLEAGDHNMSELADLFNVSRPTIYRERDKAAALAA